jgi:hypothetical protein
MSLREEHLRVLSANGAVRCLTIEQTQAGRFQLRVLPADGKEVVLTTSRGRPREWVQLNALADHLRDRYVAVPLIRLVLTPRSSAGRPNP